MTLSRTLRHGLYAVSWATILATLATLCVCGYLYFFQGNPPIAFLNLPFPVDRRVYHPGERVTLLVKYRRYIDALVTRSVYLNDSYPIPLELTTDRDIAPTGTGTVLLTYTIPPNYVPAEGDDYFISGSTVYHVNFLRDRIVTWRSEVFRIEPPPGVSPRPSVHHPVQGVAVEDQQLLDLIERSHPSSPSSAASARSSSLRAASASPSQASASASSAGAVLDPLLDGVHGAAHAVKESVPQLLPLAVPGL